MWAKWYFPHLFFIFITWIAAAPSGVWKNEESPTHTHSTIPYHKDLRIQIKQPDKNFRNLQDKNVQELSENFSYSNNTKENNDLPTTTSPGYSSTAVEA